MPFLVRKIECGKWMQRNILADECPSADAITNDLRTSKNTLSFWLADSENEIDDTVLAIVSNADSLDTIDVVPFDSEDLRSAGLTFAKTEALCNYPAYQDRHFDVIELTSDSLRTFAGLMVAYLKAGRKRRYPYGRLKSLLTEAIAAEKLTLSALRPGVQRRLNPEAVSLPQSIACPRCGYAMPT